MNPYLTFKDKFNYEERQTFLVQENWSNSLLNHLRQTTGDWWFRYYPKEAVRVKYKFNRILEFYNNNKEYCTIDYINGDGSINISYFKGDVAMHICHDPTLKQSGDSIGYFGRTMESAAEIEEFIEANLDKIKPKSESIISLLQYSNRDGYYLKNYEINNTSDLNLIDNYNEGFTAIHEKVMKNLTKKDKSMTIFHGTPGCGKTTYLRFLVSELAKSDCKVVYLPPNVTQLLANPDFISSLELFRNSVVIIEDAENVLVKNGNRSQAISNILNITDGMLADIFNIHFIFTFNVDVKEIDAALLRKGRLDLKYEFKELTSDKVKLLCEKIGTEFKESKTLAEIYNSEDNLVDIKETKMLGFLTK